ncbi:cell division protein FtsZ [Oricola indica]|uniref:cell division protein FtsZ n=1 Tax=Oricola indica TaxID=2872591 RepID=UPI001CBB6B0E|nr:cell division protein FtsZ [Oricola indica]
MTINLQKPDITELKPRITVFGVGGGGGNAVNNMINAGLEGVDFVVANTDAQALSMNKAERIVQLGLGVTEGLGAGSQPDIGRSAAEECIDEINDHLNGTHMCFVTAGMGGGTGTGAAPVVASAARAKGILTVGVVTKPFHFEGQRRMRTADAGIEELQQNVDTLIVIPNQNLFRIANDKTTFADAFGMADQVLYSGVACITDLMVKEGLINLDFADVRSVMREMGKAMMGTGEASGEGRAMTAAEAAIANPLLDETSMKGAQGLLISITGGRDMTLFEVDEAATRIREEVDQDANIILGATFDESLEGIIRVSVVATGIEAQPAASSRPDTELRAQPRAVSAPAARPAAAPSSTPAPSSTAPRAAAPSPAPQATAPAPRPAMQEQEVSEVIREAERDMSAFEQKAAAAPAAPAPDFKPQSRLFTSAQQPMRAAPATAPIAAAQAAPAAQAPAPAAHAAPARPQPVETQMSESPRMPRVEDFPPMVQAEVDSHSTHSHAGEEDDRGPIGLLKRLTHGLSRDEKPAAAPKLRPADPGLDHGQAEPRRQLSQDAQLYAPRRGQLDDQGRQQTHGGAASEDDQLEIPAFLRRQAN